MEFVTESGVVSIVATCRKVVGPHGVCYGEWSGVRCRDLPESLGWMAEAWLGRLVGRNSSLSQQSKRSSDVFKIADGLTIVGCLGIDAVDGGHPLEESGGHCGRSAGTVEGWWLERYRRHQK